MKKLTIVIELESLKDLDCVRSLICDKFEVVKGLPNAVFFSSPIRDANGQPIGRLELSEVTKS